MAVLPPANNAGETIDPNSEIEMEALDCYIGCIEDFLVLACNVDRSTSFASEGQDIVNNCCTLCVSTIGMGGDGVAAISSQCQLVP